MENNKVKVSTSRIHWIDIARGIGIILVLYGHLLDAASFRFLIYAFHIPLFFFLSGMVFKNYPSKSFMDLLLKNGKQLLVPYVFIALLTYGLAFVKPPFTYHALTDIQNQLFGIAYGNGNDGMLAFNVALWFLPCLFITKMIFTFVTRTVFDTRKQILLIISSAAIGILLSHYFQWLKLPFGIETALTALVFFAAGFAFKQKEQFIKHWNKNKLTLSAVALSIFLTTALINYNLSGQQVDMRMNRLNNDFLFYLSSFSGIALCLMVSIQLKKQAFLEYLGKNSLILFTWHTPVFVYLKLMVSLIGVNQYAAPLWYGLQIAYLGLTGMLILGIQNIINKLKLRKVSNER